MQDQLLCSWKCYDLSRRTILAGSSSPTFISMRLPSAAEGLSIDMCREDKPHACILIAEVVMVHANEGVLEGDDKGRPYVDLEKLAPVSRLGHLDYALTTETIEMEMPHHKMIT